MYIEEGEFGPFQIWRSKPCVWTQRFYARVVIEAQHPLRFSEAPTLFLFDEIGAVNEDWYRVHMFDQAPTTVIYFRTLAHATLFVLTWGGA